MTYITRQEILDEVSRIKQGLKEGENRKWAYKELAKLAERGKIAYGHSTGSDEEKQKIRSIIINRPGIKYRDLAKAVDRSVNWVKIVVRQMDDVYEDILTKERGMYGKKPYGLWVDENDDASEVANYVKVNGKVLVSAASDELEYEENYLLDLAHKVPEIRITQTKRGVQLLRWAG